MFKLESFITPYILGYVGKYIKNFNPDDFQLSLWRGDAVFQNLSLDLKALDEELNLPLVTLVSGHLQELKIYIPWTRVTYEPIHINVNTVELTLRLKSPYNEDEEDDEDEESGDEGCEQKGTTGSVKSKSSSKTRLSKQSKQSSESRKSGVGVGGEPQQAAQDDPPPSGFKSLISQILSNVQVTFENVIIKFVEEDIALSLNIRKVSYFSANHEWSPAFVEVGPPNFVLRKMFRFEDVTVCLDQINQFGKVDAYQEPFLQRCAFSMKISKKYKSAYSKSALFTKTQLVFNEMNISVADMQVPMFKRLLRATYYSATAFDFDLELNATDKKVGEDLISLGTRSENWTSELVSIPEEGTSNMPSVPNKNDAEKSKPAAEQPEPPPIILGGWMSDWLSPFGRLFQTYEETYTDACEEGCQCDVCMEKRKEEQDPSPPEPEQYGTEYNLQVNTINVIMKAAMKKKSEEVRRSSSRFKFVPLLSCEMKNISMDYVMTLTEVMEDQSKSANYNLSSSDSSLSEAASPTAQGIRASPPRISPPKFHQDGKATCMIPVVTTVLTSSPDIVPKDKLVIQFEGISSSMDIDDFYTKLTYKLANFRVMNYERNFENNTNREEWRPGKSMGIVISSGDIIPRNIVPLKDDFNQGGASSRASFTQSAEQGGDIENVLDAEEDQSSKTEKKFQNAVILTFTRVMTSNYYERSGIPFPIEKFHSAVMKYDSNQFERLSILDTESERYLSELDVKIRTTDIVINPEVFTPYIWVMNRILNAFTLPIPAMPPLPAYDELPSVPVINNNSLPLLYLEVEAIRLFLKAEVGNRVTRYNAQVHDFILLEFSSISAASHTENPLNRTIVSPVIYQLGERSRTLQIPSSPIEDRQYLVEIKGVRCHTGFWAEVQALTLQQLKMKKNSDADSGIVHLNDDGGSPSHTISTRVYTHPIFEGVEINLALAPAIVFARMFSHPGKRYLVAGHAIEVNILTDCSITISIDQLDLLREFCEEASQLLKRVTGSSNGGLQGQMNRETSPDAHSDSLLSCATSTSSTNTIPSSSSSSTGSLGQGVIGTPVIHTNNVASISQSTPIATSTNIGGSTSSIISSKSSNDLGSNVTSKVWRRRKTRGLKKKESPVVVDFLLATGVIDIRFYNINSNIHNQVISVVPLISVIAMQPHAVVSWSQHSQKVDLSLFELYVRCGTKEIDSSWIPGLDTFTLSAFDSLPGERDPKTGVVAPFFSVKLTDFISHPSHVTCGINRPIKIEATDYKLNTILRVFSILMNEGGIPVERKLRKTKIISHSAMVEENREYQQAIRRLLAQADVITFTCNQILVALVEKESALSFIVDKGSIKAITRVRVPPDETIAEADTIQATLELSGISLNTTLQNRLSPLVGPFGIWSEIRCAWTPSLEFPMFVLNIVVDPVSIYLGPHNLLSIQQVHVVFKEYIDELNMAEEEVANVMEQIEPTTRKRLIFDSYEDDLRAGSFKFVRVPTAYDLPQIYQIAFCESYRTMTWKYPQPRVLTTVEASPVPLDYERNPASQISLDCEVEYWDDAMYQFRRFGAFTLTETSNARMGPPTKEELHMCISTIWRVRIVTPMADADCKHLVRPEILAACLKVDSVHDPSLVAKLKVFAELPRVNINFVNSFYFAGTGPSRILPYYNTQQADTFKHDQIFCTCTLEGGSFLLSVWSKHCVMSVTGFAESKVLDYEFLTMAPLLDPCVFNTTMAFYEQSQSTEINSEIDLYVKELIVKVGASAMHTLSSSYALWKQQLAYWDGTQIYFDDRYTEKESVNVNLIVILNKLGSEIKFQQSGNETPLSIPYNHCAPFFWIKKTKKQACKIGVKGTFWAFTSNFELNQVGYTVRTVQKKPIFIHIALCSKMQRVVTVTGSLLVANALSRDIEVAVLPTNKSSEIIWEVPGHNCGETHMMLLTEIEHFRFRIKKGDDNGAQPWSAVVSVEELTSKTQTNGAVFVNMFEEMENKLRTLCVWCSLVVEKVQDSERYLVLVSPFFRVQSLLPSQTIAQVATQKPTTKISYSLKGMGEELEIDFVEDHSITHHLRLKSAHHNASSPSIPLLPEGPILKISRVERPIDEILTEISTIPHGDCMKPPQPPSADEQWPFINETFATDEWQVCDQPKTELEVEFSPWIGGLPTIRLQFRPWALIVNLTGTDLLFSQCDSDGDQEEVEFGNDWFIISSKSVFSPKKVTVQECQWRFGLRAHVDDVMVSDKLRLWEEQRKSDIHHINTDGVIPLDSFSRLDLISKERRTVGYLTIEARIRQKMIIVVVRPTFSVVNNTPEKLYIKSLALSSATQQTRGMWEDEKLANYDTIPPSEPKLHSEQKHAFPLHHFSSDFSSQDYQSHMSSVKYLALSCGGPWWFVKVMDFSVIFNNMNAEHGVLAASVSVTIPKYDTSYRSLDEPVLELSEFENVTMPLLVSWTSKNGQVWISVSPEPCPHVVLHNATDAPFLYVQGKTDTMEPIQETDCFEQYLVVPPNCKAYYTFPRKNAGNVSKSITGEPLNLLITKLPRDLQDLMRTSSPSPPSTNTIQLDHSNFKFDVPESPADPPLNLKPDQYAPTRPQETIIMAVRSRFASITSMQRDGPPQPKPKGTLLVPGTHIKWSKLLNVEGDSQQYLCVGEYVDTKIRIEKIGFCYYVFIESLSAAEVAAKDVRKRISGSVTNLTPPVDSSKSSPIARRYSIPPPASTTEVKMLTVERLPNDFTGKQLLEALRRTPHPYDRISDIVEEDDKPLPAPFALHCYIPKIMFTVTDDVHHPIDRRQLLCFTVEDILVKQIPMRHKRVYKALFDRVTAKFSRRDFYTISVQIGDVQLDSPSCAECGVTCDFPVILKPIDNYDPIPSPKYERTHWRQYKLLRELNTPGFKPSISVEATYGQSSPTYRSIESVFIKTKPFYVNVEDRLLDHIVPTLQSIVAIVEQQYHLANRVSTANLSKSSVMDLHYTRLPSDIDSLLKSFSSPILFQSFVIEATEVCLTLRIAKSVYLAVDHSRLRIAEFRVEDIVTTTYHLGQALSTHFTTGALFQIGNPMRLIGSLELLGSPGTLVEVVGGGLKDFVVYPYQGIFQGPTGFIAGLGSGMSSLLKSITSGALTSVTNWAWSVSRNIDRLTLDEEELYLTESARRVQLAGFADGLLQGLTGFGIRVLGAIGGLAHHPLQNVINQGASPSSVLNGVSRGVVGMVTRPIGGLVQLVAMTGQGVLRSAGWTPQFKIKGGDPVVDQIWNYSNSMLKYQLAMRMERGDPSMASVEERFVLLVDAMQPGKDGEMKPVSLLLSNLNLYIIDTVEDMAVSHFPVSFLSAEMIDREADKDGNLICLKIVPPKRKKDDVSFAKERIMDFVAASSSMALQRRDSDPDEVVVVPSNESRPGTAGARTPLNSKTTTTHILSSTNEVGYQQQLAVPFEDTTRSRSETMFTARSGSVASENSEGESSSGIPPFLGPFSSSTATVEDDEKIIGQYYVSAYDKTEFDNALVWLRRNSHNQQFFSVQI